MGSFLPEPRAAPRGPVLAGRRGPGPRDRVAAGRGSILLRIARAGERGWSLARVALAAAVLGTSGCRMPERAALARVEDGGACPEAAGPRVCVAADAPAGFPYTVVFRGPNRSRIRRFLLPGECLVFPLEARGRPVRILPPQGGGRARRLLLRAGAKVVVGEGWRGRRVRYDPCGP